MTVCALSLATIGVEAQQTSPVPPAAQPRLLSLESANVAGLPQALGGATGVSVRASKGDLEGNPAALAALQNWVRTGGVVFLHNDAAQIFGYATVPGRQSVNARGGQFFGRARAALGFNASPLLADDGFTSGAVRQAASDITRPPGVNVVFYEMAPGDVLVTSHPTATPLLEVTDLASGNDGQTLYAAAIAPYGSGWAVFTPDFIDNRRADGALFLRNILKLMPAGIQPAEWIGLSVPLVEQAAANPSEAGALVPQLESAKPAAPALPGLGAAAPATPAANVVNPAAPDQPKILISRSEAASLAVTIRGADRNRTLAALQVLRARLEWQRQDGAAAVTWLNKADGTAPGSAEVAFWRGCLWTGSAQDLAKASPVRSEAMTQAANAWQQASTAPRLFPPVTGMVNSLPTPAASVPAAWVPWATRLSQAFAAEPPVVEVLGSGNAAIVVRHFANDDTYALSVTALTAIARSNSFGWRADREEVLLFPNERSYATYRTAVSQSAQSVALPAGNLGDVIGSRILMVGWPSFPTFTRLPNGVSIPIQQGTGAVNVIARFHAYVLMNALTEDGASVPGWMRLGLETMLASIVQGDKLGNLQGALQQYAAAGGLLTPEQFNTVQTGGRQAPNFAEAQAASMMLYFYDQFGPGAVAETLQRLGSKQTIDEALDGTTGLNQANFFRGWRNDTFGPQTFPNAG